MNKIIGLFFSMACFATSAVSSSIMGAGMWFWLIIIVGSFVAVSQFYSKLRGAGAGLALSLSMLSVCAVVLGVLAATIGGSFRMDESTSLLMFLFCIVAVLGVLLAVLHKDYLRSANDCDT